MTNPNLYYVHEYLCALIEYSNKTQAELAEQMGFKKPNFLTMLKQGKSRVPLDRVPAIAKALDVDPAFLLWMCIRDYHPELLDIIQKTMGYMVTPNEYRVVDAFRDRWGHEVPHFSTEELEAVVSLFAPSDD